MRDLCGRLALVTGASGGLGAVIARRVSDQGVEVVLNGRCRLELAALARTLPHRSLLAIFGTGDLQRIADGAYRAENCVAPLMKPTTARMANLLPRCCSLRFVRRRHRSEAVARQESTSLRHRKEGTS